MRAAPLTVAALAAALLLTACSSDDGDSDSASDTSCKVDEVDFKIGPVSAAPAVGDTGLVPVTITKKGTPCTLSGVPGAEFHTSDTWDLVPSDTAKDRKMTVSAQAPASFTITYVRGKPGSDDTLAVKTVKFFLAGSNKTRGYTWSYGDVAIADTDVPEPNAMVSGFQPVGD